MIENLNQNQDQGHLSLIVQQTRIEVSEELFDIDKESKIYYPKDKDHRSTNYVSVFHQSKIKSSKYGICLINYQAEF